MICKPFKIDMEKVAKLTLSDTLDSSMSSKLFFKPQFAQLNVLNFNHENSRSADQIIIKVFIFPNSLHTILNSARLIDCPGIFCFAANTSNVLTDFAHS